MLSCQCGPATRLHGAISVAQGLSRLALCCLTIRLCGLLAAWVPEADAQLADVSRWGGAPVPEIVDAREPTCAVPNVCKLRMAQPWWQACMGRPWRLCCVARTPAVTDAYLHTYIQRAGCLCFF